MTTNAVKSFFMIVLAAASINLVGCADKASPDNVDRRAIERWNYLIAHQAEKAYDYLSPGFQATQTRDTYAAAMNNRALQWKNAKFKSKECDADRCKAEVDVAYAVSVPGVGGKAVESASTQSETWLLINGQWYLLPK